MTKEKIKRVPKAWGEEIWLVNCKEYCGKLLKLRRGVESSYHYHRVKKETFYALEGQIGLNMNGKGYMLNPFSRPKTIYPGVPHSFTGLTDATILEISTHHDDDDVYRITESKP